jgi:hypothetical protein
MSMASLRKLTLLALIPLALLVMFPGSGSGAPTSGSGSPGTGSGGSGQGSAGQGGAGATPLVSANVEQCVTGDTQASRSVTFAAQMETVAGAHRMEMQIMVLERAPGDATFHPLTAAGPWVWQRSEAGLKIYKYVRQVTNLPAPAAFRAIVQYRWLGDKGRVIKTDALRTPVCRQPGERPKPETAPAATMLQA